MGSVPSPPAHADGNKPTTRHYEVWAGADATENVWLLYSGTTLSPFGDIHDAGLRLRFVGGYGRYAYAGLRAVNRGAAPSELRAFDGETSFADALVGYLWRFDPLIVKGFVGASGITHSITPHDPDNVVQGLDWGFKGVAELWLNIGETAWSSLDLSYTDAHRTYAARARVAYRILPTLSIGIEAGLNGNAVGNEHILDSRLDGIDYQNSRGGGFVRYEWDGGEISASAGVSGDIADPSTPYATINWITQF